MTRLSVTLLSLSVLCACSWPGAGGYRGDFPAQGPLLPDTTIKLTQNLGISLEKLVFWSTYVGVAYLILDPTAPNWEIEQAQFPDGYCHLSLKMKRLYAGGAGEARVVFHRQAKDAMRQGGYDDYQVVEYSEGMESSVLGSQRVAQGVVLLTRK
ncbi:MAG TPA: hypothetical protein VJ001_12425 [Rhodocyclaceae bacterium]|nr:hypothetical protein [Rhodocyclaceae bacterium]